MAKVQPFHTKEPEIPSVYHNESQCPEGQKIKPQHLEAGVKGRLCEVCQRY